MTSKSILFCDRNINDTDPWFVIPPPGKRLRISNLVRVNRDSKIPWMNKETASALLSTLRV